MIAPLASPAFTGTPTAPTPVTTDATTKLATTAFVSNKLAGLTGDLVYQGTWDAATNTPTLADGVGTSGHYYIVSVSGPTLIDGAGPWLVGDYAILSRAGKWQQIRRGLTANEIETALGYVPLPTDSGAMTGTPTAPTVTPATDASTKVATTAFVHSVTGPLAADLAKLPQHIGDTPPLTPAVGDRWWHSTEGQALVYYNDGATSQWVQENWT